jgi:hypothetical protein
MIEQLSPGYRRLLLQPARLEIDQDGEQGPTGRIYLEGDERPAFFLRY